MEVDGNPFSRTCLEKYIVPSDIRSSERYMIPRKCYMRMTQLQILVGSLEKNNKLQIIIHIPNSSKLIKVAKKSLDENTLKYVQERANSNGFYAIPLDVTVLYEYKHSAQIMHPSIMQVDVDLLSSILKISRTLGSCHISLAKALQMPLISSFRCKKDSKLAAIIDMEVYSINISRSFPTNLIRSNGDVTDELSESSFVNLTFLKERIKSGQLLFYDDLTNEGLTFSKALKVHDFIIPVRSTHPFTDFFNVMTQDEVQVNQIKIIIVGNDYFFSMFLREFISYNNKQRIPNGQFNIYYLALSKERSIIAEYISQNSEMYKNFFFTKEWFNIFLVDSIVQNIYPLIYSKVDKLINGGTRKLRLNGADVFLLTETDQIITEMFSQIIIKSSNEKKPGDTPTKINIFRSVSKQYSLSLSSLSILFENNLLSVSNDSKISKLNNSDMRELKSGFKRLTISSSEKSSDYNVSVDGIVYFNVKSINLSIHDQQNSVQILTFAE